MTTREWTRTMSTSFIRRLIVLAILSITLRRLLWLGRPHHNYMHHMRLYTEGQHRHQHHPQWDEWFRPLNELMVYANNDAKTAADNNRTQFESMWNHSLTHTPPGSQKYLIMYYHVMKTGGSSLFKFFQQLNVRNGYENYLDVPGLKSDGFGLEEPGYLKYFKWWRNSTLLEYDKSKSNATLSPAFKSISPTTTKQHQQPPTDIKKLALISFREPIERAISHYFQLKPCPNGYGGGYHQTCREDARSGFDKYLKGCHFASDFQSRYIHKDPASNLHVFDFVLRSDRMEESFILMSLRFRIPIVHLILINSYKVRTTTTSPTTTKNNSTATLFDTESRLCTDEWMKILVPESIRKSIPCEASCAGRWGRYAITPKELSDLEARNSKDLDLWNNYVIPRYDQTKQAILEQYHATQTDLDITLDHYKKVQNKLKNL